jgi:FixJ family two-component response regulator
MPQVTGLAFLASSEGAALCLPVILLTGRGDESIRARACELGVKHIWKSPWPTIPCSRLLSASLPNQSCCDDETYVEIPR